jgi:hypothetical protein
MVRLVRGYVYIEFRKIMSNSENSITFSVILCYYRDTNDSFSIGGLVDIEETPMEAGISCHRKLMIFVHESDRLSLLKVIDGAQDFIYSHPNLLYMLDVKFVNLNMTYITR